MKNIVVFISIFLGALLAWQWEGRAEEQSVSDPEAQVLVKYKGGWKPTAGGEMVGTIDTIGIRTLQFDSEKEAVEAAQALETSPAVLYAEVNTPSVRPLLTPNDPQYGSQWHLSKIAAPSAWDYQTGADSTQIAVIDTGIDGTHADLTGKVVAGKHFVGAANTDLPADSDSDPCGHGTAVAGLAAASSNNSVGVAGVNWQARLLPIRVIDTSQSCEFGFIEDLIEAIQWAADVGAKVINVSLGTTENSQALRDAVVYAKNKGSMVVAAAGNGGSILYPAAYPEAIAVGATGSDDGLAGFSSIGSAFEYFVPAVPSKSSLITNWP